ncbi:amino acid ABC transporter permease [Mesorhizobium sp. M8A.F.Ca.ET.173.01.1.1]|nr:amino acid ABC transporter permease [Mesorhizobium sp. M8A.F.Ca.ET.173.01.1.1]
MFSFQTIVDNFPLLLWSARLTLLVSILGVLIGLVIGAMICIGSLSARHWLRRVAITYISFFRGVPLLVQLLLVYYLLPSVGINASPLVAAVTTVGLCSSAYVSEYLRGAINAIPAGQREAAVAIGMAPTDIWIRIILPQALKISLPSIVNELILLVKASSLVSLVGVPELTLMSKAVQAATYRPLEIYLAAACIYLAINLCLAGLGQLLEKRLAI